jgi:hypothetical protein
MFIIAIIFMTVFIVQSKRVRSYKKTIETNQQTQEWEKDKVPIASSKFRSFPFCFNNRNTLVLGDFTVVCKQIFPIMEICPKIISALTDFGYRVGGKPQESR